MKLLNINSLDSQQTFVLGGEIQTFGFFNSFSHSKEDCFNFCSELHDPEMTTIIFKRVSSHPNALKIFF
jgi:hypothetical protein